MEVLQEFLASQPVDEESAGDVASARASAYGRYFELAQDWDLESADAAHRADKDLHRPVGPEVRRTGRGSLRGQIQIPEDFDELPYR